MAKKDLYQQPETSKEHGLALLYQMILIRRFEEKSEEMYQKKKIQGNLHLYIGEEAVAVGVMQSLSKKDSIFSTYREHGHALARGIEAKRIMAELYGKQEGCSHGRGGSMHLFDVASKFYGGNAIVAGHLPMAVGMALASKMQNNYPNITCCFFGDDAVDEGAFHESMNLAVLWNAPVLFICENNCNGTDLPLCFSGSMWQLEKKALTYDIKSDSVNGMDVLKVEQATAKAVNFIKTNMKPYFLVCNTFRFRAQSMFDAELYKDKMVVDNWKKRDPIAILSSKLLDSNLVKQIDIDKLEQKVLIDVALAVDYAESGTLERIDQLTKFVYSNNKS